MNYLFYLTTLNLIYPLITQMKFTNTMTTYAKISFPDLSSYYFFM